MNGRFRKQSSIKKERGVLVVDYHISDINRNIDSYIRVIENQNDKMLREDGM